MYQQSDKKKIKVELSLSYRELDWLLGILDLTQERLKESLTVDLGNRNVKEKYALTKSIISQLEAGK